MCARLVVWGWTTRVRGGATMRNLVSSRWLLVPLLSLVTLLPSLRGQVVDDGPLIVAARDGNLTAVRTLIAKRSNVNEPARDGSTALLWAVYHSDVDMVRSLLAAGATVDAPN